MLTAVDADHSAGAAGTVHTTVPEIHLPGTQDFGGYRRLFDSFKQDTQGRISRMEIITRLRQSGIEPDDPRIVGMLESLEAEEAGGQLDYSRFAQLCPRSGGLLARAITNDLAIPDFPAFVADIIHIYDELVHVTRGNVADYIPQLKRVPADLFAISVCTVDGQQFSIGDSGVSFCVQSVCKPINYSLILDEHGADLVHRHVGREPSGRGFNELSVNGDGLPHNPMINSGAIMGCSLIRPSLDIADRFDHVADTWQRLAGGRSVGFNNAVYLSERQTADRNFALGYFMREHNAFPQGTDLIETLEFYFQCCSVELATPSLASVAATLAAGGVVPSTNDRVFSTDSVQKCLSLMSSCGMYDYSGEFAFTIGLPAKSGVSGALMLVIPKVMGIAIWSPRLDRLGNSVRGIEFCRQLVAKYNFHMYDSLVKSENGGKRDPRLKKNQVDLDGTIRLLWSASNGDFEEVRASLASGVPVRSSDYDGRTALHLAAAGGHLDLVTYLLERDADPEAKDRWGGIPLTDAERGGHAAVIEVLKRRIDSVSDPSAAQETA